MSLAFQTGKISQRDIAEFKKEFEDLKSLIIQLSIKGEKSILSNAQLMKYLGVSRNQLYQWRISGQLNFYQKGRCIYYFMEDIKEFIKSGKGGSAK